MPMDTVMKNAHKRTICMKPDEIQELFVKHQNQDIAQVLSNLNKLSSKKLWIAYTEQLTRMIQGVIEFAKLIPGFNDLSQEDRIMLLKSNSFAVSIIRMSLQIDLTTDRLLVENNYMLPSEVFYRHDDTKNTELTRSAFEMIKSIAELQLNDTQMGFFSAIVFFSLDDQVESLLNDVEAVRKIYDKISNEFYEMMTLNGEVATFNVLIEKITQLKELKRLHEGVLDKVRNSRRSVVKYPALFREIFDM